ncbi:hypothetical protein ACH5RR_000417 [Cinchona calisaya]|uniref:Uncharacterized protein n=1 Tax=Cinchona calisaya TaxID=153742 RepID=A0ABD3B141_9GENT
METVDELLTNNRKNVLFRKLLHKGFDDDVTKKIMCLWMFLKSKAFNEIYDKLYLASPKDFGYACVEAQMALKSLENDQISIDESPIPFPITSILIDPSISLVPIFRNREKVYHEILAFLDEVNNIKVDRKSTIVKKCIYNSGSTSISLAFTQQPSVCSKLNPFAKEWSPSRLEDRILFMTFSRGQPLSPSEIRNYFGR